VNDALTRRRFPGTFATAAGMEWHGMEWDLADVKGFYEAIRNYNIAAVLNGHTHARNVFRSPRPAWLAKAFPPFGE